MRADGTKSCRIKWQWTTAGGRYAHVQTSGASGGKKWPQLDTTKSISFKILVLPVGQTTGSKFNGTVSAITNSAPPYYTGGPIDFGVTVTGSGPYTYEWTKDGTAVATTQTYTDATAAAVPYTVTVSDGTCFEVRTLNLVPTPALPIITNQPVSSIVNAGSAPPAALTLGASAPPVGGTPVFMSDIQGYQWEFLGNSPTNAPAAYGPSGMYPALSDVMATAQLTDSGYYRVYVYNNFGNVTSSIVSLQVVVAAGPSAPAPACAAITTTMPPTPA